MISVWHLRWLALLALAIIGLGGCSPLAERNEVRAPVAHLYAVKDPQFRRSVEALLGQGMIGGNRIGTLLDGDQIFPAMLAAIRSAKRSVHLETYIYREGRVGDAFARALAERARAGVAVRVIMDWIGSRPGDEERLMREAGVQIEHYHALGWYDLRRLDNRTHRKLLIVDGKVGFIGGVGLADEWLGHAESPEHWRENHYRVEGPVVAQLQGSFLENWGKVRHELLHGEAVLPSLGPVGGERAQAFTSSPGQGKPAMRTMYLLALAAATKTIFIENPYFVPDPLLVQTLVDARRRGVIVRIIVPGQRIDAEITRRASRSRWGPLLEAGVEFYEFEPTMFHCKLLVVDGLWANVGSSNLDDRSLRINDEANLNVLDSGFARRQETVFEADRKRARQVGMEEWKRRSVYEKLTTPLRDTFSSEL